MRPRSTHYRAPCRSVDWIYSRLVPEYTVRPSVHTGGGGVKTQGNCTHPGVGINYHRGPISPLLLVGGGRPLMGRYPDPVAVIRTTGAPNFNIAGYE